MDKLLILFDEPDYYGSRNVYGVLKGPDISHSVLDLDKTKEVGRKPRWSDDRWQKEFVNKLKSMGYQEVEFDEYEWST